MNGENSNTAAVFMAAIQMINSTIEKSFSLAEANAQRRHEEAMYKLETDRLVAQAEAHYKNAQALEIESRLMK